MKFLVIVSLCLLFIGVQAFRFTEFELDGNAFSDSCADDWNSTSHAIFYSGVISETGISSVFRGSTSRADGLISSWRSTNVAIVNTKDLLDAYASYYQNQIYFGTDRYGAQRSTPIVFWFLQDDVSLNTDGTFSGIHRDGDLLLVTEFDSNPIMNIYLWSGSGVVQQELNLNGLCQQGVIQKACSVNNLFEVPSPWSYVPIVGSANKFPTASFLEGGVDIELIYPNSATRPCFRKMLVASIANSQTSANMQDFMIVPLSTCGLSIDFGCDNILPNNDKNSFTYDYSWSVTNIGSGPLPNLNVNMNGAPQLSPQTLLPSATVSRTYSTVSTLQMLALGNVTASSNLIVKNKSATCHAPIQRTDAKAKLNCYGSLLNSEGTGINYFYNGTIENHGFGPLFVSEHQIIPVGSPAFNLLTIGNSILATETLPYLGSFGSDRSETIRSEYTLFDYLSNPIEQPVDLKSSCPKPNFKFGVDLSYSCAVSTSGATSQILNLITLCNYGDAELNNIETSHSQGSGNPVAYYGILNKNSCVVYPHSYFASINATYTDQVTVSAKVFQYATVKLITPLVCNH